MVHTQLSTSESTLLSSKEPLDYSPMEELGVPEIFPEGVDLAEAALQHVRRNGMEIDRSSGEIQADEQQNLELDGNDDDWEEIPEDRYPCYSDATRRESIGQKFMMEKPMSSTMT